VCACVNVHMHVCVCVCVYVCVCACRGHECIISVHVQRFHVMPSVL